MKKTLCCMLALLIALSGCTGAAALPVSSSPLEPDQQALQVLMPDKAGFLWQYAGFAEYAMTMTLKTVTHSGGTTAYHAEGRVADMSGGQAKGDFAVKVVYLVTPGVLRQQLQGPKALDNTYPDLELIRTPLAKGTRWVQRTHDRSGRSVTLACAITDVKTVNDRNVYSVTYRDEGSDYYELRELTQGRGVTSFQKLYQYDSGSDLIGYRLSSADATATTAGYEQWLPTLGRQYAFFGLAEYGHKGTLTKLQGSGAGDIYEYNGIYSDGTGSDDRFVIRYYADTTRGTVTEKVISCERGKAEVNSRLHNLVILKFPLSQGAQWSHQATLNGKPVTVMATVTEYDEAKGVVKVQYTAKGAAGYYNSTYIERRTFEKGFGMTSFGNLLPGGIGISAADAKDPVKLNEAMNQHMFGYVMNKAWMD